MKPEAAKNLSTFLDKCHREHGIKLRKAEKADCQEIARLIQELADFEKMPNGPKINAAVLEKDGFETQPPCFDCIVVESPDDATQLIGYALYYFTYSTWRGKALYLEDLYCTPKYRNKKVGASLYQSVCKVAVYSDCSQMDFSVLEWNPARQFYGRHGAIDITERESWHMYRMTHAALLALED